MATANEAARLARERALDLVRALARERQQASADQHRARADLRAVALAAVEGLEALAGIVDALQDSLDPDAAAALKTAARGAWERLESAGVVRDGVVGEVVDPSRHKVVKRREAPKAAPNTVVHVLGPGILFGKERLRDAAVVASKPAR